jgi:hypothetical protein
VCERQTQSVTDKRPVANEGVRKADFKRIMSGPVPMQEIDMAVRFICKSLALMLVTTGALAADGLQLPAAEALWPQWQARITVQAVNASLINSPWSSGLAASRWVDSTSTARSLQGASVLGDYYFATPSFGGFRASGGLLMGAPVSANLGNAWASTQWGMSANGVAGVAHGGNSGHAEMPNAATYLGLGFNGGVLRNSLAFSADFGLVAERPGGAISAGRALLGNQGAENALRELRLSPLFQVGLRYTF